MKRRDLTPGPCRAGVVVRIAAILLLTLAGGCGGHEPASTSKVAVPPPRLLAPPTLPEAQTIVASSPEFSDYEFTNAAFTLAMTGSAMSVEQRAAARDLAAAGWLRRNGDAFELTQKSRSDRRWLVRPNGTTDLVPLASKEVVEATAMQTGADGNPQVAFTWRWIPNEIGSAFVSGPVHERFSIPHGARATLLRDGANWSVLRIRPSGQ